MTSNAPRGYELADLIHEKSDARVIMGGMHVTTLPEEGIRHADQIITGEGEKVILDVIEGRRTEKIEDDNFTADKERAKEICRRMIREGLTFKETFSFGRTDMAQDEELLQLLHDAHLTRVLIGIESLNQQALNDIHKGQNIQDIRDAAAACRKYRIRMIASVVLGLDADKKEDIRRSVQFAKNIGAYQLQPAILTPYPGTPVYEQMAKSGRMLTGDWARFDMMNVVFQPKNMSPWELQEEFYRAGAYFYDAESPDEIGKVFGKEYGKRRKRFGRMARLGVWGAHFCSKHIKASIYYKLRNCDRPEPASKLHIPLTAHFTPTHCRENATINQPV